MRARPQRRACSIDTAVRAVPDRRPSRSRWRLRLHVGGVGAPFGASAGNLRGLYDTAVLALAPRLQARLVMRWPAPMSWSSTVARVEFAAIRGGAPVCVSR